MSTLSLVYRIENERNRKPHEVDHYMQSEHFVGRTDMRSKRTHRIMRGAMSLRGSECLRCNYKLPSPRCEGLQFRSGVDVCGVQFPGMLEEWFPGQRAAAYRLGFVLRVYVGSATHGEYQSLLHTDDLWVLVHQGAWHAFNTPHKTMERVFLS